MIIDCLHNEGVRYGIAVHKKNRSHGTTAELRHQTIFGPPYLVPVFRRDSYCVQLAIGAAIYHIAHALFYKR